MSYDKVSRQINRAHTIRVVRNQTAIWSLYNGPEWLAIQKPHSFGKRKAMNCSCRICREWSRNGREARFKYQLEKAGMTKFDVRPDI